MLRDDVIVLAAIEAHSEMRNRFTRYSTWPSEQNSLSRHRQKSRGQVHAVNITACCFAALLSHNIFFNTFNLMLRGGSGGFYQNLDGKQATKYVFPNRAN